MSKSILFSGLFALVFLMACSSSKVEVRNDSDLPDFALNPPKKKGVIYGTGISEQESAQLAKETADLRAKKEIANIVSQKIFSMLKDYMGQAAMGEEAEVTEFVQSVTKAITDVELNGVIIENRDYYKGRMVALASYKLDGQMREAVMGLVKKSLTSKAALLSEFRAKQGFEALNKELEKLENQIH